MPQHSSQDENRETYTSQSQVTGKAGAGAKGKGRENPESAERASASTDRVRNRDEGEVSDSWKEGLIKIIKEVVDEKLEAHGEPIVSNLDISRVCISIVGSDRWQQFTAQLEKSALAKVQGVTETAAPEKRSRRCEQRELEKKKKREQQ